MGRASRCPNKPPKQTKEMKREGRQHGSVRTHLILPPPFSLKPKSRVVNQVDSPPTAGVYTKVPSKPTNHSKFTGKCNKTMCTTGHVRPACKSKDKAKGTYKLRSSDVVTNQRLVSWRVVDQGNGLSFTGVSATGILGQLSGNCWTDGGDEDAEDVSGDELWCETDRGKDGELISGNANEFVEEDEIGPYSVGLEREDAGDEDGDWFLVGKM